MGKKKCTKFFQTSLHNNRCARSESKKAIFLAYIHIHTI